MLHYVNAGAVPGRILTRSSLKPTRRDFGADSFVNPQNGDPLRINFYVVDAHEVGVVVLEVFKGFFETAVSLGPGDIRVPGTGRGGCGGE